MSAPLGDRLADLWGHVRAAMPSVVTTQRAHGQRTRDAFELGFRAGVERSAESVRGLRD